MTTTLFDGPGHRAVMTYNLKNGKQVTHWHQRRDRLAEVIRAEAPLLVGTQEGFRFQLRDLCERLPGYDYIGDGRYSDLTDEHVAILYDSARVTIHESGTFWLAETHDLPGSKIPGEDFPRIATWARMSIDDDDADFVMVNTHLTWQDVGLVVQTATLVRGIDRVAPPELDVVLTGDFNQPRFTETWQTVTGTGFVDAVDFVDTVEGPPFTFANWDQWSDERVGREGIENRIDWIMYRPGPGLPVPSDVHLRVINTHTEPDPPSDHFPVVLTNQHGSGML